MVVVAIYNLLSKNRNTNRFSFNILCLYEYACIYGQNFEMRKLILFFYVCFAGWEKLDRVSFHKWTVGAVEG